MIQTDLELLRWFADKHDGQYEPTPHGEGCVSFTIREAITEIEALRTLFEAQEKLIKAQRELIETLVNKLTKCETLEKGI